MDFTGPSAFMIGNEGQGLSDEITAEADKLLRIPMVGELESLNAGASATIVAYEFLRQRIQKADMLFL
jgi:TrmH family RNA methyltransferase